MFLNERHLLLEIRRIILMDEVLDYIVDKNSDSFPPVVYYYYCQNCLHIKTIEIEQFAEHLLYR
jgi:hypothetical protein